MADFKEQIVIDATTKGFANVDRELNKLSKSLESVGDRLTNIGKSLSLRLTAPITAFGALAVRNFANAERGLAKLNASLSATGRNGAGVLDTLVAKAAELQKTTIFAGDDILETVSAGLLRFGNISGEVFDRAQKQIVDIASVTGSLEGATKLVARALATPVEALTLLRREGIVFSESQTEVIKQLIETGRQAEAQGIILDSLNAKYAESAKLVGDSFFGQLQKLKNEFNDFLKIIGQQIGAILQPFILRLTEIFRTLQTLNPEIVRIGVVLGALLAVLGPVSLAFGLLTKALILFLNPVTLAITGIIAVTSALDFLAEKFEFTSRVISFVNGITLGLASGFALLVESTLVVIRGLTELGALIDTLRGKETVFTSIRNEVLALEGTVTSLRQNLEGAAGAEFANAFGGEVERRSVLSIQKLLENFDSSFPLFENKGVELGEGLSEGIAQGIDQNQVIEKKTSFLATTLAGNFSDAFVSIGEGAKSVSDAFSNLASSIIRSLTQRALTSALENLFIGGGAPAFAGGGQVQSFATGGAVSGAGTSTSDSIPAFLSNGEYVLNAKSTKALGLPLLNALNGMKSGFRAKAGFAGFANGGEVSGGGGVVVNVINNSSQPVSANADIRTSGRQIIIDTVLEDLSNNGVFSQQLQNTYGVRR